MPSESFGSVKIFWPDHTRDELIARLRVRAPALRSAPPVTRAVLFGSWAHGRATAFSDVDLLVVYANPPRPDAFHAVVDAVDLQGLEPHSYAESEAAAVAESL